MHGDNDKPTVEYTAADIALAYQLGYRHGMEKAYPLNNEDVLRVLESMKKRTPAD